MQSEFIKLMKCQECFILRVDLVHEQLVGYSSQKYNNFMTKVTAELKDPLFFTVISENKVLNLS